MQNYFTKLLEDRLKACAKPQYVDDIPKVVRGTVQEMLDKKDDLNVQVKMCEQIDLTTVKDRNVEDLSGGELQRFACAIVCTES